MLYMVTFTINIPQMLAYIPYMDYIYIYIVKEIIYVAITLKSMEHDGRWFSNICSF